MQINYAGVCLDVTDSGIVSLNGKQKKQYVDKQGYKRVGVWIPKDKKTIVVRVHTLVALAFIDPEYTSKGLVVNHKDLNKSNNLLSNLEVVTEKSNAIHAVINKACTKTQYHGIIGYTDTESIFAWRLRELESLGFNRKRVAKAIKYGLEYKNFHWTTLEVINHGS